MTNITFYPFGESGIKISFGNAITPAINQKIISFFQSLVEIADPQILDMVPCYTTLMVYFDVNQTDYGMMKDKLNRYWEINERKRRSEKKEVLIIPTYYGGDSGPDITRVAEQRNISEGDVIKLHSSRDYLIYMMGFLPGFPYLGGLDPKLETPRLDQPRDSVAEGSVGIAGNQTGLYPIESPGGWNIIGRTPLTFFNPESEEPFQFKMGQYIRFQPIGLKEFHDIQSQVSDGGYQLIREWK